MDRHTYTWTTNGWIKWIIDEASIFTVLTFQLNWKQFEILMREEKKLASPQHIRQSCECWNKLAKVGNCLFVRLYINAMYIHICMYAFIYTLTNLYIYIFTKKKLLTYIHMRQNTMANLSCVGNQLYKSMWHTGKRNQVLKSAVMKYLHSLKQRKALPKGHSL